MAKRFDAARLFEPRKDTRPSQLVYPNLESSLDAVRARTKGMDLFHDSMGTIATRGTELAEWLTLACERDLLVILQPERLPRLPLEKQPVNVFISRAEELWRIPAFLALWETAFAEGRWSDAAENQLSLLLGYTKAQRKKRIEASRQERPAWTCATVYALLDADQRKLVDSVGRRCFGPSESIEGMPLLFATDVLKRNAFATVPRGSTLARVGLGWNEVRTVFGTLKKAGLTERKVTRKLAPLISAGLQSNVQFLSRAGWK